MNWTAILPELYFCLVAAVFFVFAMRRSIHPGRDYATAMVLAAIGIAVSVISVRAEGLLFFNAYQVDLFSQMFKVLISVGLFLVVWLCMEVDVPAGQHPEFYLLLTTCAIGMMCLVSSVELLTLYVSLELTSYSLYVLMPLRSQRSEVGGQRSEVGGGKVRTGESAKRGTGDKPEVGGQRSEVGGQRSEVGDQRSEVGGQRSEVGDQRPEVRGQRSEVRGQRSEVRGQRSEVSNGTDKGQLTRAEGLPAEAGLKYFLIGATTSAVMLFGLATLFGAAGTTYMKELVRLLPQWMDTPMGFVGLLFTLSGFFFKLAFFPFHVWGPTVYEAASNQTTTYIATTTKVVAIAVIVRIAAMSGGSRYLPQLLLVLAVASMSLGNLAALVQRDLKRMLAYSAIAHAGYAMIGVLSMSPRGYAAALFYAVAYLVMTFICFLVVIKVSRSGRNVEVPDLAGLHRRSPLLAMALMVGIFSLGGIPPTIGFTGKFLVLAAAMEKGHFVLVLIAMGNVALSLYYYIQVIRAAYLLEPQGEVSPLILSGFERFLTAALIIVIVIGGIYPKYFYEIAMNAAGVLP